MDRREQKAAVPAGEGSTGTPGSRWWGEFPVPDEEPRYWRIGPAEIWACRRPHEWSLHCSNRHDSLDESLEICRPRPVPPDGAAEARRYGFRDGGESIELTPRAADRPMVFFPERPFFLPAGEELSLFVGSAVWIRFQAAGRELFEHPSFRPSDTWFGPSTIAGELCYSAKTSARLHLANLPVRPHRAVSVVRIRNRADDTLSLERLKVPMPNLSLFASADGRLWTEQITLDREEGGEFAELKLGKSPPEAAGRTDKVAGPRVKPERKTLVRAFTGILLGRDRG